MLTWPEEPTKDEETDVEIWTSTCGRYQVHRAKDVKKIVAFAVSDGAIADKCKGVIGGMAACSKHLAKSLEREPEREERQEEITSRVGQVQRHGKHGRSKGGTVASKIADRLRQATRDNPVTLAELAQINVDSTGADMSTAERNTIWYLGHMRKGDRGMPHIEWSKRGHKYHVE